MIVGIGSDIVEHSLNEKLIAWDIEGNLAKRILSKYELETYIAQPTQKYLAGRFAAKEAILKCLGSGMHDGISLKDIEILGLANGKPAIKLTGYLKQLAEQMEINKWHISITHSPTSSIAFAIAEKI